jgi:uncharacterized protein
MSVEPNEPTTRLAAALQRHPALAIAVSGGVDSLTLATVAHRVMTTPPLMVHAVSAAVPAAATVRVRQFASSQGWQLREIVGGEFADADYLANPYDRCYHCKSNLYRSMRAITERPLASGTNVDDLSDYRPGLQAAAERDVVHPFVDAGIDKRQVRAIARQLGLDCAELPAQPCLASRIETGIPIRAPDLGFIDTLESRLREMLGEDATVRVRVRAEGVEVELGRWPDPGMLSQLDGMASAFCAAHAYRFVAIRHYRQGSAFVAGT